MEQTDSAKYLATLDEWLDKWNSAVENISTTSRYLAKLLDTFPDDGSMIAHRVRFTAMEILNGVKEVERQNRQLDRLLRRTERARS